MIYGILVRAIGQYFFLGHELSPSLNLNSPVYFRINCPF